MFDLTLFDFIYIGVIFISTVWATIRGGVYETLATISWIAAAIIAKFISPLIDGLLQGWFGLSESTIGTLIASYFVVFFVVLILFGFVNSRIRDRIQDSMMKLTDHTLGVIFGIVRGVLIMGLVYWGMLWYYSDKPNNPVWLDTARTRPVVQLTAVKINEWFVPGGSLLLTMDAESEIEHQNLINPAIETNVAEEVQLTGGDETGYKSSERNALENQLLQIKTTAQAEESINQIPEEAVSEEAVSAEAALVEGDKIEESVQVDEASNPVNDMSLGTDGNIPVAPLGDEADEIPTEPTPVIQ